MKKSVYSLVLMDDVIRAVDEKACQLGTSRSNLINQILAQHLSCITPEMRIREIFDSMNELVSSTFRVQQQRSLMTMNTALEYKYRPTLSYRVELERVPAQFLGTLKVSIRTQSQSLSGAFMEFFRYWSQLESRILEKHGLPYACAAGNNSFSRRLINCPGQDCETQGSAISRYIAILDGSIKLYLADGDAFRERLPGIAVEYENLLDQTSI